MSASMFFNEQTKAEVEIEDGEVTLWLRSDGGRQVAGWTLTEQQRMNLIEMLQSPKEVEA